MPVKNILFVCNRNAGRSQMAEYWFNTLSTGGLKATSAGTKIAENVHPIVVQVMKEAGIVMFGAKPKMLTKQMLENADKVISMGCDVTCGILGVEDWGIEDPEGKDSKTIHRIMEQIKQKVKELLRTLS